MRTSFDHAGTRDSLTATAARNTRWFTRVLAGTAVLGSTMFAATWEGDTSADWNDVLNWSGDAGTGGSNAIINSTSANIATIAADIVATPIDILVGDGGGTNGRLIHTAGAASTGDQNWMVVGRGGGTGIYDLSGSGSMTVGAAGPGGRLYVGADGTGTVNMNTSGTLTIRNDLNLGVGTNGNGIFQMDGGTLTTGGWNFIGNGNGATGTFNQTGGSFSNSGRTYVGGRNAGETNSGIGNYNISGGVINQNDVGLGILVAEEGDGTLTVSGTAEVNVKGVGLFITTQISGLGSGVVNLNGGTITCRRVAERDNALGNSTFNFNGGVLKAGAGSNADFMSGLDSAVVGTGGAIIDTNGETIAIAQQLNGTGALTKQGAGTLLLNATNTYPGATTVTAGTLAGNGSVAGPLVVSAGAVIAPGNAIGTFGAAGATVSGSFACQIDGASNDQLAVSGALDLSSATDSLDIAVSGAGATLPVYVIASYTTLNGTFNTVNGLPSGYSVDYAYNGGTQIALVQALSPYQSWVNSYFPGETNPAIIGAAADPDGDGQANNLEFALGGAPDDGADNAKVYHLAEDSGDAGTAKELLMTIAVRNGGDGAGLNPVFTPVTGGNPASTQDGMTYTIQGGTDLTFSGTVSVVAPVTTGLPAAPAGYEYRTFSLEGSDGLPSKGFLRVNVTP